MREEYCKTIYSAVMGNYQNLIANEGIYSGKEGCLRLAREYGAGLADFKTEAEIRNDISSSYSVLCVRLYNLKPPVDAKEWVMEIYKGLERARRKGG